MPYYKKLISDCSLLPKTLDPLYKAHALSQAPSYLSCFDVHSSVQELDETCSRFSTHDCHSTLSCIFGWRIINSPSGALCCQDTTDNEVWTVASQLQILFLYASLLSSDILWLGDYPEFLSFYVRKIMRSPSLSYSSHPQI